MPARRLAPVLGGLALLLLSAGGLTALGADALVLGRDVAIRQAPDIAARVIQRARPGELLEVVGRRGKGQSLYLDERGELWMKIRLKDKDEVGFVQTDFISIAREEYRSPKQDALLLVNLKPSANGTSSRELWVVQDDWQRTRRLAEIEGQPIWGSEGEWFLVQVDSNVPVKDQHMERTVERIEKFSADGRGRTVIAVGSYPVVNEPRGEVYFYRDVDERGDSVPPGLFAASLEGGPLRPIYLLPERFRFWKEDGDFYVQVPRPVLHAHRVTLYAYDRGGGRFRFTVSLDGHFVEQRRD
jgi:hypothetical protein